MNEHDLVNQNYKKLEEINFLILQEIENSIKSGNKYDLEYWMERYNLMNPVFIGDNDEG